MRKAYHRYIHHHGEHIPLDSSNQVHHSWRHTRRSGHRWRIHTEGDQRLSRSTAQSSPDFSRSHQPEEKIIRIKGLNIKTAEHCTRYLFTLFNLQSLNFWYKWTLFEKFRSKSFLRNIFDAVKKRLIKLCRCGCSISRPILLKFWLSTEYYREI